MAYLRSVAEPGFEDGSSTLCTGSRVNKTRLGYFYTTSCCAATRRLALVPFTNKVFESRRLYVFPSFFIKQTVGSRCLASANRRHHIIILNLHFPPKEREAFWFLQPVWAPLQNQTQMLSNAMLRYQNTEIFILHTLVKNMIAHYNELTKIICLSKPNQLSQHIECLQPV